MGAAAAALAHFGTVGLVIVTVLGLGSLLVIWVLSRREIVGHGNAISDVDVSGAAVNIPTKKERRKMARAKAEQKAEPRQQAEPNAEQETKQ